MEMKNKKITLDPEEIEIENNVESFVPVSGEERNRIEALFDKARKNTSISLRINPKDLIKIKEKADENGLPYQTLITNVLHRYVNDEFYDKKEVIKTLKVLKSVK
jgi:predicted DNA binding CopG/RHH family protein